MEVIDKTREEYTPIWIEDGVNARIEDDGHAFIIINNEDNEPLAFIWKSALKDEDNLIVVNRQ